MSSDGPLTVLVSQLRLTDCFNAGLAMQSVTIRGGVEGSGYILIAVDVISVAYMVISEDEDEAASAMLGHVNEQTSGTARMVM